VVVVALIPDAARSQKVVEAKGVKIPEYYEPPHERQLKSLLEGAKVQPQANGQNMVSEAKYRTWREDGEPLIIIEAPQCLHDSGQRTVSSAGPLRAQTADGMFSIEGEGFLWLQTNSSLFISNHVHTIVHADLLGARPANPRTNLTPREAKGLEIFSDQFEGQFAVRPDLGTNFGLGIYRGDVGVIGTNVALTAGMVTVQVPMRDLQRPAGLQRVTAEQNVILDYEELQARQDVQVKGDRANYATDTGLARITGHPTWRTEQRDGGGEELIVDRTNRLLRALGEAYLNLAGQGLGGVDFLPRRSSAPAGALSATNRSVEIRCDNYDLRSELGTNTAIFRRDVRVTERTGDQLRAKLNCGLMRATFAGTNELQRMVAEENVIIEQGDEQFTGGGAIYNGAESVLELTDQPAWRAGLREGKGDLLLANTKENEMIVRGHASMRLPAEELGQTAGERVRSPKSKVQSPQSRVQSPELEAQRPGTNRFAEIFAEEYRIKPQEIVFRGKVRMDHPRMQCDCEKLTARAVESGEKVQRIVAERDVVFDLIQENARKARVNDRPQKVHGTGDKAVYSYGITAGATNEVVELTGNPAMLQTTNCAFQNPIIILDCAHDKVVAPGRYQIQGTATAVGSNAFRLLRK
jgi:lipopolysaccharide export system protein LptA